VRTDRDRNMFVLLLEEQIGPTFCEKERAGSIPGRLPSGAVFRVTHFRETPSRKRVGGDPRHPR